MDAATTQPLDRIIALEQENAILKSRLQRQELEYAALRSQIAECQRGTQMLQEQVAVAREQEKAALERAAELAKANAALRHSIDALTHQPSIEAFLSVTLQAIAETLEVSSACLWKYEGKWSYLHLVYQHGQVVPGYQTDHPNATTPAYLDTDAYETEDLRTRPFYHLIDDPSTQFTDEQRIMLQQIEVRCLVNAPIVIGDRAVGSITARLTHDMPDPSPTRLELVNALANQAALALQMSQLAEEAKQAAIAREQEKAALERAAELAKANAALRHSIDALTHQPSIEAFLSVTLQAIAETLEVPSACLWKFEDEWSHLQLVYQDGSVILGEQSDHPNATQPAPYADCHLNSNSKPHTYPFFFYIDDPTWETKDLYTEILQELGVRCLLTAPIVIGDRAVGSITARLTHDMPDPSPTRLELVNALANQAALALQMSQLAEEAKQAAIAKEQEKAALERAAELAKANAALRHSIDALTHQPSIEAFLSVTLQAIAEVLEVPSACLWKNEDEFAYLQLVYQDQQILPAQQTNHVNASKPAYHSPNSYDAAGKLRTKPFYYLVDDPASLLTDEQRLMFQQLDVRCFLVAPIIIGDRAVGSITARLTHDMPDPSPTRLELVNALANQAALALQMSQLAEEAKQAAIAREQEKAAQERAAELAKANEALQASLSKLADEPELDKFLGHVLRVCAERLGAVGAGIWQHEDEIAYLIASYEDGNVNLPPESPHPGTVRAIAQQSHNQESFVRLSKGEIFANYEEDFQALPGFKPYIDYLQHRGIKSILYSPMFLGDALRGSLSLRFDSRRVLTSEEAELAHALANQATLALELTRLAEEAKQTAIAKEQEKAAQERAAKLAQANEVLRSSTETLTCTEDLDTFLGNILLAITKQLGARSSTVWVNDNVARVGHLKFVVEDGIAVPAAQSHHPNAHIPSPFPPNAPMPNFLTGKAQPFITATSHDPGLTDEQRQYLEAMGVRALLAAPMILGDEHIGTFTVRLEAERSLPEEDLELIQALANQATLAVQLTRLAEEAKHSAILEERNRLAGEIHDTLAQAFTGISLHLDIAKHLIHEDLSEAETTLNHIGDLAKTGLTEARRSVWALHPDNAEYANLVQKLTHCLEQMTNGTSIHSEITIHGTPYPLPPFIGKNLLRIGQEAITNAIRHAQATHLWVELNYEPGYVDVLVRDNGCGFSLEADTGGFGLFSLSQRVKRIGGQLNFRTQPGDGTEVLVQVAVRQ